MRKFYVVKRLIYLKLGLSSRRLNDIANSSTGAFEPRRFWTAWERGAATTVDVVAPDWDFWGATPVPLEELRAEYGVPPTDASLTP